MSDITDQTMQDPRARDKDRTKDRLVAAVGEVLADKGFGAIGVNAVARAAGVDKVLIYRYFGGLDGLVQVYAASGDFWPSVDELIAVDGRWGDEAAYRALSKTQQITTLYGNLIAALRRRPLTLEILAWEMIERNELTARLEDVREKGGHELMERFAPEFLRPDSPVDFAALVGLISAAINYLASRARHIRVFNGINLREDAGWARIEAAIAAIFESMFAQLDTQTTTNSTQ